MLVELDVEAVDPRPLRAPPVFGETDEALARKVPAALAAGLEPILCVGESEEARDAGETEAVLERQLQADLAGGRADRPGRGRDRLRADLGDRHRPHRDPRAGPGGVRLHPRRAARCAAAPADEVRILYGGSVKPANAAELLGPARHRRRPGRRRQPRPGRLRRDRRGGRVTTLAGPLAGAGHPRRLGAGRARARQRDLARRDAGLRPPLGRAIPHTQLSAQGRDVGLPDGQMGNSEVGHLNLGAGAIVKQDLARIDDAVADGSFFENEALLAACERARNSPRGRLHLLGLVSDGGVHSGWEHIEACDRARLPGGRPRRRLPRLHRRPRHAARTAAAATSPSSSAGCARPAASPPSAAATTRWTATPAGSGPSSPTTRSSTPGPARRRAPRRRSRPPTSASETDEFVKPTVIGDYDGVAAGDVAIFVNFRPDRARADDPRPGRARLRRVLRAPAARPLDLTTMTSYRKGWPYPVAFPEAAAADDPGRDDRRGRRPPAARRRDREVRPRHLLLQRRPRAGVGGGGALPGRIAARRADLRPQAGDERPRRRRHLRRATGRAATTASGSSTSPTPTWSATPA